MKKQDFIVNEKELLKFVRFNNIFEKFISTNVQQIDFINNPNKEALIQNYIKNIVNEKKEIIKNHPEMKSLLQSYFWALNKNYEEIVGGAVKKEDLVFSEFIKG